MVVGLSEGAAVEACSNDFRLACRSLRNRKKPNSLRTREQRVRSRGAAGQNSEDLLSEYRCKELPTTKAEIAARLRRKCGNNV